MIFSEMTPQDLTKFMDGVLCPVLWELLFFQDSSYDADLNGD
jgi:hypothetical protein